MAQWINGLQNNGFINPMQLPLLCEKTGALAIVEPGLTASSIFATSHLTHPPKGNASYPRTKQY